MTKEPIIAVFCGGTSAEREVSLGSGKACAQALARNFSTQLFEIAEEAVPGGIDPMSHRGCVLYTWSRRRLASRFMRSEPRWNGIWATSSPIR